MTQQQLASKIGVTAGRISQLKRQGMPTDSIEAAESWLALNVNRDKPRDIELPAEATPDDMGPKARLLRAQEGERRHFALWEASIARKPINTREVSELASTWREMRKGASEAEREYATFLSTVKATVPTHEASKVFRDFVSAVVQDFSTRSWGEEARGILRHHLSTMPRHLASSL